MHSSTPHWGRAHELHAETVVGKHIVRDYQGHRIALGLSIFWNSPSRKMWVEHKVRKTRLNFLGSMPHWAPISETDNPEGLSSSISATRARRTTPRQAGSNTLIEVIFHLRERNWLVVPLNIATRASDEENSHTDNHVHWVSYDLGERELYIVVHKHLRAFVLNVSLPVGSYRHPTDEDQYHPRLEQASGIGPCRRTQFDWQQQW